MVERYIAVTCVRQLVVPILLKSDLIVLLLGFGGQACRSVSVHKTLIFQINLLNAPASNVKNEGTPFAQLSVRRRADFHDSTS